jgi:hypothetical protein
MEEADDFLQTEERQIKESKYVLHQFGFNSDMSDEEKVEQLFENHWWDMRDLDECIDESIDISKMNIQEKVKIADLKNIDDWIWDLCLYHLLPDLND